jgi:hypothetical protein
MAIFLSIPSTIAACHLAKGTPVGTPSGSWPLIALWAFAFLGVSAHFRLRCLVLQDKLAAFPPGIIDTRDLGLITYEVLDHWSICTTAFVLEGWQPAHVVIRQEGFLKEGRLYLFPTDGNPLPMKDGRFTFGHLPLPRNNPVTAGP